jgi:hypothetical protein
MPPDDHHHILIHGTPWCRYSSSVAGSDAWMRAGMPRCGHDTLATATQAVQALRPFFRDDAVQVKAGVCPVSDDDSMALPTSE